MRGPEVASFPAAVAPEPDFGLAGYGLLQQACSGERGEDRGERWTAL